MAQNFKQIKMRAIGTAATDIPDGTNFDSFDCIIGLNLANTSANAIQVSAYITNGDNNNNPADDNKFYIFKDAPIPNGGALSYSDKINVISGDRLWFESNTASSLDVICSFVDAIST